jgi:hypothetical protein
MRIGVLLDELTVSGWEARLVHEISRIPEVEAVVLIETGAPPGRRARWTRWLRRLPFRALTKLESLRIDRAAGYSEAAIETSIDGPEYDHISVSPTWSASGLSWSLDSDELRRVEKLQLDLMLRLNSGVIRGAALHAARQGILSMHHGDNREYRGAPPGFWEVAQRRATSGYTIQFLTEILDGGRVVGRGTVTTQTYYLRNQRHLFLYSVPRLLRIIERLSQGKELLEFQAVPYSGPLYRDPGPLAVCRYLAMQITRLACRWTSIQRRRTRWQVGVIWSNWRNASFRQVQKLPPLDGCWLADPFIVEFRGRTYCFAEEFDVEKNRGHIVVFDVSEGAVKRLGIALEEEFHLSFPFVFVFEGALYMCPETADRGQVRLYRCEADLLHWELHEILLDGVVAADPMLVRVEGSWRLLINIDECELGDFGTGLWQFSSPVLEGGVWRPSELNPVVFDSDCARNGGLLRDGEEIYRVGQSSDFDEYGSRVSILHCLWGADLEYSEEPLCRVTPDFLPGLRGTHHVSGCEGVTALDMFAR